MAIATGKPVWPTFEDGMLVNQLVEASFVSSAAKRWVNVSEV